MAETRSRLPSPQKEIVVLGRGRCISYRGGGRHVVVYKCINPTHRTAATCTVLSVNYISIKTFKGVTMDVLWYNFIYGH